MRSTLIASLLSAGALAVVAMTAPARAPGPPSPTADGYLAKVTTTLGARGIARVRSSSWWGRAYATAVGETVDVSISSSYPADDAVGQAWADFFARLVHADEFRLLESYIATPAEVQVLCGSAYALGCYGGNRLVVIGETVDGVDPHEVAAHEYGHHVAANRLNPPWNAEDWGPKRWASNAGVCQRVASGTAFPGDEDQHYAQNPGEAFAEAYRFLYDSRASLPLSWGIIDASFIPGAIALAAVQDDVLEPYVAPASKTLRGRFTSHGPQVWKLALSTRLDGLLVADLEMGEGSLDDLALVTADGHTVLARGLWTGTTHKRLSYTVCGQRRLTLRVTRMGSGGRFSIAVAQP
jgi:hypothetical protein